MVTYAEVSQVRSVYNMRKGPADEYGQKLPTNWQVRVGNETRWRKVFAVCYSNVGSFYVEVNGKVRYIRDSVLGKHVSY